YGKTKSCHNAGYWSHVGSEEPKIHINLDRAFRYYTKACDKKIPQSCHNLGILYSDKNDFENSMKYFEKGCELKFIPSCYQAMNKILEAEPKNPLQIKQGLEFGAKICDLNKDFCNKSKQDKIMKNMNLKIQKSLK
ncbi:MAG: sel1 repeat family protein, partial [Campylobacter sp.]|nr:sel1 repeat family protein [Campylobacter sp.]